MRRSTPAIVQPEDSRPIGPAGACTYCHRVIGLSHGADCVIPQRTVVVDYTARLVVKVPAHWTEDMIDFRFNESSWCADNLTDVLDELSDRVPCLCPIVSAEYIREATPEDEESQKMFVDDPSTDD